MYCFGQIVFLNLNFFLFLLSPPSFYMSKAFPPIRFVLVHFSCVFKTWYVFFFVYFPTSLFLGPEPGAVMFAFRRRVHAGRKTCVLAGIIFVTWGSLDTPCLVLGWVVRIRGVGEQCPSLNAFPKQKTKTFPKTLRLYFLYFLFGPCGFWWVYNLSGLFLSLSLSLSLALALSMSLSLSLSLSLPLSLSLFWLSPLPLYSSLSFSLTGLCLCLCLCLCPWRCSCLCIRLSLSR